MKIKYIQTGDKEKTQDNVSYRPPEQLQWASALILKVDEQYSSERYVPSFGVFADGGVLSNMSVQKSPISPRCGLRSSDYKGHVTSFSETHQTVQ